MKRGARGLPITYNRTERWRFVQLLYLLNDEYQDHNLVFNTKNLGLFDRPAHWPERKPLTCILAWVLMPNHFHLLLEEIHEGGIAKFMQRLCGSMTTYHNAAQGERGKGSLFQGGYKGKVITTDTYLRQIIPYVMVKNVFELYPGGYKKAVKEFERAWKWAVDEYPFSSLGAYIGKSDFPIVEKGIAGELFPTAREFKVHVKEMIMARGETQEALKKLTFE
jgi:putative transposase